MEYCHGVVFMGSPARIVFGSVNMHLRTDGDLVKALLPRKDVQSLVKVIAELTQNVMDWSLTHGAIRHLKTTTPGTH